MHVSDEAADVVVSLDAGRVGFAQGVFDMFHVGHLNLLCRARLQCDYLIAGVVSDELAAALKGKLPIAPETERLDIVASMDVVDRAVLISTADRLASWREFGYHVVFKGDDWQGTAKGDELERTFADLPVSVGYLPYTTHTSSTRLRSLHVVSDAF